MTWLWVGILVYCGSWTAISGSGLVQPGGLTTVGGLIAMAGAALLLGWGGLVLQAEMSPAVAGGTIAAIASIPTAVSFFFWAGSPAHYAERLPFVSPAIVLVGAGWSLAVLIHRVGGRHSQIPFREGSWVELLALLLATIDAFCIVITRTLSLWDTLILLSAFSLYVVFASRLEPAPPVKEGPMSAWREYQFPWRQVALAVLGAAAGAFLLLAWKDLSRSAEAAGYGHKSPWVAALIDESPVMLTGLLLILQDRSRLGIRVLVASLVIQSTLWVGLMPLGPFVARVFSVIRLGPDQTAILVVYAAMLFYVVLLLSGLALTPAGGLSLAALLVAAVLFEGPWVSWLVAGGVIAGCVGLVLSRRAAPSRPL